MTIQCKSLGGNNWRMVFTFVEKMYSDEIQFKSLWEILDEWLLLRKRYDYILTNKVRNKERKGVVIRNTPPLKVIIY